MTRGQEWVDILMMAGEEGSFRSKNLDVEDKESRTDLGCIQEKLCEVQISLATQRSISL